MIRRVSETSVRDSSASDSIRPGLEPAGVEPAGVLPAGFGPECLLVPFETFSGARNMSIDQSLLEAVDAGGPAVLRFYGWSEPTLSLGYFQSARDRERHRDSGELTLVRRATGGGAIVHDRELTYSVAVRPPDRSPGAREELYQGIHAAIAEGVEELGLRVRPDRESAGRLRDPEAFLCFQRRTAEDLVAHGYKILGSAQRRGRHAVLQHGSLLLRASPHAPELPGVEDLVAASIEAEALSDRITERVASRFGWRVRRWRLPQSLRRRAAEIERERFAAAGWTDKR